MAPAHLEKAIYGVFATPALHLAAEHGVLAYLIAHDGADAAEVATALRLTPDTVERLLLTLGAFEVIDRDDGGRFRVPDAHRPYLDPDDPRYLGGFLAHLVESTADRLRQLPEYLVSGKPPAGPGAFDEIYRDDASVGQFLAAMWQLSFDVSTELVELAELDGHTHLVDVGGANGPFSVAALRAHPDLRATVFDLPAVEPHLARTRHRYGLDGRLDFVGGDFFRDPLPGGDCISFGYILSDWTDETCLALLRAAHDACAPGGRVVVMERLFDHDKRGPLATAAMNLSMHVETDGRHRSAAEYVELLHGAGFVRCDVRRSTQDKHLVIGHRSTAEGSHA
ncbi:methyltransferase [Virgisporangium ochraceum]|uniref:Hydroxyneurosporene-O-methyltransferase n=1 Tax=Virgisporangium ochraceum TaxID=65505 RepID=A0A8J4A5P7_9ACTN|nr:methyltransferase [Virgisporangium ochraceum]GIJ73835.1 hydroxyneurosporene-O-methyltransferase [Virgisporangium ochraceum]